MILADTSVWIDHFRRGNHELAERLDQNLLACHSFVIGELACGNLRQRTVILGLLQDLPRAPAVADKEILLFIELQRLMGRGIGYIDAHLLASCTLEPQIRLWTLDKRLRTLARELDVAY